MSRLIDAEILLKSIDENCLGCGEQGTSKCKNAVGICLYQDMREIIEEIPESIVRCKDCKHNFCTAHNHGVMCPRCLFTQYCLSENDFCSFGERREG